MSKENRTPNRAKSGIGKQMTLTSFFTPSPSQKIPGTCLVHFIHFSWLVTPLIKAAQKINASASAEEPLDRSSSGSSQSIQGISCLKDMMECDSGIQAPYKKSRDHPLSLTTGIEKRNRVQVESDEEQGFSHLSQINNTHSLAVSAYRSTKKKHLAITFDSDEDIPSGTIMIYFILKF